MPPFLKVTILILGIVLVGVLTYNNRTIIFETFFNQTGNLTTEIPLSKEATLLSNQKLISTLNSLKPGSGELATKPKVKFCSFGSSSPVLASPTLSAGVIFNEVAWMGNETLANNEWIELKNISEAPIDISDWQVIDKDEQIKIVIPKNTRIGANNFYLLARDTNTSNQQLPANLRYGGSLKNNDEALRLYDSDCRLVDEIFALAAWPAGANDTKKTMERAADFSWQTALVSGGTPGAANSVLNVNFSKVSDEVVATQSNSAPIKNFESTTTADGSKSEITSSSVSITAPLPQNNPINKVFISEVMAGSEGNSDYEFIELYNAATEAVDLTNWTIKKRTSTGKESTLVVASRFDGKIIPPQKHFLIANANWSGSINADILWPASYTIAYVNNAVIVYNAAGEKVDEAVWIEIPKGQSLERVSWTTNEFRIQALPSPKNSLE